MSNLFTRQTMNIPTLNLIETGSFIITFDVILMYIFVPDNTCDIVSINLAS